MQVWSLGQKDPLEEEMATHSSSLAWKIPRNLAGYNPKGRKELDTAEWQSPEYTLCGWKMMYFRKGKKKKKTEEIPEASLWLSLIASYHSAIYKLFPNAVFNLMFKSYSHRLFFSPNLFLSPCSFYEEPEAGNCGHGPCHWLLKEDESSRETFQGPSPLW